MKEFFKDKKNLIILVLGLIIIFLIVGMAVGFTQVNKQQSGLRIVYTSIRKADQYNPKDMKTVAFEYVFEHDTQYVAANLLIYYTIDNKKNSMYGYIFGESPSSKYYPITRGTKWTFSTSMDPSVHEITITLCVNVRNAEKDEWEYHTFYEKVMKI